jgi:hypothetical protein
MYQYKMGLNKNFIEWFNKNRTKEEYSKIFNKYFVDLKKCRICNDVIYYYDSTFLLSKLNGNLVLKNKSCLTSKILDKEYYLSVCEECLTKKYPEYQQKNKSRVFNQMNYITEYAFDIERNTALKWMKEKYAITENNLVKKWGETIGKQKWIEYRNKQSITNKFEYKKEKYGWTKQQFDDYNKSRRVTLENLVIRHGEYDGLKIWKDYCDRQKYTTSVEYFIDKYGFEAGTEKYNNFCKKRINGVGYSDVSKKLFTIIAENFINNEIFYAENEWYFYDKKNKKYYLVDFYIKELNIGIEFNGDMWHANPEKYSKFDKPFPFQRDMTAEEIWNKDKIKNDFLRTKLKKLIIIWESDLYRDGINNTVAKITKEICE